MAGRVEEGERTALYTPLDWNSCTSCTTSMMIRLMKMRMSDLLLRLNTAEQRASAFTRRCQLVREMWSRGAYVAIH